MGREVAIHGQWARSKLPDASANDASLPPQVHPLLLDTEIIG